MAGARLFVMYSLRRQIARYRLLNFFIVAAFLLATLLPVHFHLHHPDTPDNIHQIHTINLHTGLDSTLHSAIDEAQHSDHDENTHIISVTPESLVYKTGLVILALLFFLTPLLLFRQLTNRHNLRPDYTLAFLQQQYHHLYPPLRAPPR